MIGIDSVNIDGQFAWVHQFRERFRDKFLFLFTRRIDSNYLEDLFYQRNISHINFFNKENIFGREISYLTIHFVFWTEVKRVRIPTIQLGIFLWNNSSSRVDENGNEVEIESEDVICWKKYGF
jgi:hypothetical protein